jgi:hypothetical protein
MQLVSGYTKLRAAIDALQCYAYHLSILRERRHGISAAWAVAIMHFPSIHGLLLLPHIITSLFLPGSGGLGTA